MMKAICEEFAGLQLQYVLYSLKPFSLVDSNTSQLHCYLQDRRSKVLASTTLTALAGQQRMSTLCLVKHFPPAPCVRRIHFVGINLLPETFALKFKESKM